MSTVKTFCAELPSSAVSTDHVILKPLRTIIFLAFMKQMFPAFQLKKQLVCVCVVCCTRPDDTWMGRAPLQGSSVLAGALRVLAVFALLGHLGDGILFLSLFCNEKRVAEINSTT